MDPTEWQWPAEVESVLVTLGNGALLPSPRAETFLLHSGSYLALRTENKEERTRGKLTVLVVQQSRCTQTRAPGKPENSLRPAWALSSGGRRPVRGEAFQRAVLDLETASGPSLVASAATV